MGDQALIQRNGERWADAHFKAGPLAAAKKTVTRLLKDKKAFVSLSKKTGVPWDVIAVIKERESGADPDFLRNIAQGDPWNRKSTHDPKGRGPFSSWEEAGIDALVNCAPYAAKWKDWSAGGTMTILEKYNGLGYAKMGRPSPYIWAGSDQYRSGKFVADHVYDPDVVDSQLGCAVMLKALRDLDDSSTFDHVDEVPSPKAGDPATEEPKSVVKSKISWTAWISGLIGGGGVMASDNPLVNKILSSDTLAEKIVHALTTPKFFIGLALIAAAGAITYFYWSDHGKGTE